MGSKFDNADADDQSDQGALDKRRRRKKGKVYGPKKNEGGCFPAKSGDFLGGLLQNVWLVEENNVRGCRKYGLQTPVRSHLWIEGHWWTRREMGFFLSCAKTIIPKRGRNLRAQGAMCNVQCAVCSVHVRVRAYSLLIQWVWA